jgi:hypothetical protein
MQAKNEPASFSDRRVADHIRLLSEAAVGNLDGLQCPSCDKRSVSVWFTQPEGKVYRTWFVCAHRDFNSRAQNNSRPGFFSEDRVRQDFEERDLVNLRNAIFRVPDSQ